MWIISNLHVNNKWTDDDEASAEHNRMVTYSNSNSLVNISWHVKAVVFADLHIMKHRRGSALSSFYFSYVSIKPSQWFKIQLRLSMVRNMW